MVVTLFDNDTSTLTYILVCKAIREAIIIDPVDTQLERDLEHIKRLRLQLKWILETHVHADHITSSGKLREVTGAKIATPQGCGVLPADYQLKHHDEVKWGAEYLKVLHTPGHTQGSVSFYWNDAVFTGDTLLIEGCGRADFQGGCADALYTSLTEVLFALPDTTYVYPGHDYRGQRVSTIGYEKLHNPRIAGRGREEFINIMAALNLEKPKKIDIAVPANRALGQLPHGA